SRHDRIVGARRGQRGQHLIANFVERLVSGRFNGSKVEPEITIAGKGDRWGQSAFGGLENGLGDTRTIFCRKIWQHVELKPAGSHVSLIQVEIEALGNLGQRPEGGAQFLDLVLHFSNVVTRRRQGQRVGDLVTYLGQSWHAAALDG